MPIFEDIDSLNTFDYDYIIVGGGTAGLVLANRLTENPNTSVLVLEAGFNNLGVQAIDVPLFAPTLGPSQYNWRYSTVPQPGLNNRAVPYPRGKVLGGSSSINYNLWNVGSQDDWERYASITDDTRWSWDSIQSLLRRVEKYVPSADGHDTSEQLNIAAHSTEGAVAFSVSNYTASVDQAMMETIANNPIDFPFQKDMNLGNTIGIGWSQVTIDKGRRATAAASYLSNVADRPNLSVLIKAHVTRIINTGIQDGLPLFGAVEFVHGTKVTQEGETNINTSIPGSSSPRHQVKAHKEVILSAGVFNTPQILMLSGIGDKEALEQLDISSVVHSPCVGKGMSDHAYFASSYISKTKDSHFTWLEAGNVARYVDEWTQKGTGPLTSSIGNHMGYFRLPESNPVLQQYSDPSSGKTSGHFEMLFIDGAPIASPPPVPVFCVCTAVASPHSRGSVTLSSKDPFASPLINPQLLSSPYDVHVMLQAIRKLQKFVSGQEWKKYELKPISGQGAETDDEIIAHIREKSNTMWHACGTAAATAFSKSAAEGVVGPDFKVIGAAGLRIVDASVLPIVPSTHPMGVVFIIAEMAADMIRAQG